MPVKKAFRKWYKKQYVKKTGRSLVPTRKITEVVNSQILKNIETKQTFSFESSSNWMYNYANNEASFLLNNVQVLGPYGGTNSITMAQGTTQATRVGNRIRPVLGVWTGLFFALPYNATTNPTPHPYDIRILVYRLKGDNDEASNDNFIDTQIFNTGATETGLSGLIADMVYPINKDKCTVYRDFMIKIGYQAVGGTGTQAGEQSFHNNDYKMNRKVRLDVTKYIQKELDFSDNTTACNNNPLRLCIMPVSTNAGQTDALDDAGVGCVSYFEFKFKDA